MTHEEFQARWEETRSEFPELTESQVVESAENLHTFGYPYEEESERVLDAWAACLGGTSEKYINS